ncbi:TetR/AcrR family transcriptional regulator C-terminal domain-containing protein [Micromonospora sp. NPDC049891]|uniref:TetR/AcrR family transcriptional regulator n=1 Tax=Micromonospora sp. NPDC049891 TaxID=3155655 RepID=UPI0033D37AAC
MESNAEHMIEVATTLVDTQGVDGLTLRAVARHAGQPLAAVQHAFGSRDRLVAALVQHLLAPHHAGPHRDPPVEKLARLAEQEWQVYRAHPWLVGVLASTRPPLVPAVLDMAGASVEAFVALGLSPAIALRRYLALNAYIQGMALLLHAEQRETANPGTTYRSWWAEQIRRLDRTGSQRRHPWLGDVTAGTPPETFDADTAFRDGLHRVLIGLTHNAPGG